MSDDAVEQKESVKHQEASTDVAALSASAIAASISLFSAPGKYSVLSLIVSISLLTIVASFLSQYRRRTFQSISVAAAAGLASLPGAGFLFEMSHTEHPWQFFLDRPGSSVTSGGTSLVSGIEMVVAWTAVVVVAALTDILLQRRLQKRAAKTFA